MRTKKCQHTCTRLLGYGFRMNPSNTSQRLPYSGLHLRGESPGDLKQQHSTLHLSGKRGSKITAVPSMSFLEWRDVPLNVFCKYYRREKCSNYCFYCYYSTKYFSEYLVPPAWKFLGSCWKRKCLLLYLFCIQCKQVYKLCIPQWTLAISFLI